jgi:hypothetical protein
MAGNDGDVVVALDLEIIGLVGVGLAAARHPRMVWLFKVFEPLFGPRILRVPPGVVAGYDED